MEKYKLEYDHPSFIEHADGDSSLRSRKYDAFFEAASDEEALRNVEEFIRKPTGERYFPSPGKPSEDLMNTPRVLSKIVKQW